MVNCHVFSLGKGREIGMKMEAVLASCREFLADESGLETVEWGIVSGIIVMGTVGTITAIAGDVRDLYDHLHDVLERAGEGPKK